MKSKALLLLGRCFFMDKPLWGVVEIGTGTVLSSIPEG